MKKILILFFILVFLFFLSMSVIFIPWLNDLMGRFFLVLFLVFSLLGALMSFLVSRSKEIEKKKKNLLLIIGISAFSIFTSIVLHNGFYALGVLLGENFILNYLIGIIHAFFFLLAVVVFPILFLLSSLWLILILLKKN